MVGYLLAALAGGLIPLTGTAGPDPGGIDVYLTSNGVHTDLILPALALDIDWQQRLPPDPAHPMLGS